MYDEIQQWATDITLKEDSNELEVPQRDSQPVTESLSGKENNRTHAEEKEKAGRVTQANLDLACLSASDPNLGLFMYLNLAPGVKTEEKNSKL